jgi:RimJ/RimL family protein N-acetyltransferase
VGCGYLSNGENPPVTRAPPIETERLSLEGHQLQDFADCRAMWMDPVVTRFIGGKPSTSQEVWHRLLRYVGHWAVLGFGYWVVREKASGQFVGEVGFADWKRDLEPSFGSAPEMGYALAPWCYGRGFATEAALAATAWGDANLPEPRTWCLINPEAKASIRVAEKCGYRELDRTTYNAQPIILFERSQ